MLKQSPVAMTLHRQRQLALATQHIARMSSKRSDREDPPPPKPEIDREAIRKRQQDIIEPTPGGVSTESTTQTVKDSIIAPPPTAQDDENIRSGLKHDIGVIRDTFKLSNIPRESHILGLAGTIPYLATSMSTLYLAWDLSTQLPTGNALLDSLYISHDSARYLLSVIEPLQLGYGAVIISFLGAIHWGLEYGEMNPSWEKTRFRYGMGVAASIAAWPTLLLSIEYGLTAQFMAFVALYFADSRAASRGWAPRWYGQYRFLLTAMVGLAIFASLVGRSQIEKSERLSKGYLSSAFNRAGIADTTTDWAKLEEEEKRRIKKEEAAKERKAKQEEQKKKQEEKAKKAGGNGGKKEDAKEDEDAKDEKKKDEGKDDGKDESKDESKDEEKDDKNSEKE